MKDLYIYFLSLVLFVALHTQTHAQCEPDTSLPDTAGIYPLALEGGEVGQPYLQTINFVFPTEITIFVEGFGDVFANLCAYSLDSVSNIPTGMDFECNEEDCTWDISFDSGTVNRGCINISGIPESRVLPDDSLRIFLTISPGLYSPDSGRCVALQLPQDIIQQYAIQEFRVPFIITGDTTSTSLAKLTPEIIRMEVFPNPAPFNTTLRFVLPEVAETSVEVLDLIGRSVFSKDFGKLAPGSHEVPLNTEEWKSGMYFVRLDLGNGASMFARKLTVR